jgi:PTS system mannose-specific IIC component
MSIITDNVILLALIAALCALDANAFGQFMICRPIFCAPLIGFLMGDIDTSLWVGMIAEMLWINSISMGVAVPIDVSVVGILPVFWGCKYFMDSPTAAIWGLVLAIPFAYIYRKIDISGRYFNIKIMHWIENGIRNGEYNRIDIGVAASLGFLVIKAFLFYVFAMVIGGWIYKNLYLQLPWFVLLGLRKSWYLLPIAGFGTAIYNFKSIKISFFRR